MNSPLFIISSGVEGQVARGAGGGEEVLHQRDALVGPVSRGLAAVAFSFPPLGALNNVHTASVVL